MELYHNNKGTYAVATTSSSIYINKEDVYATLGYYLLVCLHPSSRALESLNQQSRLTQKLGQCELILTKKDIHEIAN